MKAYILLLTLVFLLASCDDRSATKEKRTEQSKDSIAAENYIQITNQQYENGDFEFGRIEKKEVTDKVRISGQVNVPPKFIHAVNSQFEGYVDQINLIEGDYVEEGDVLFTLKNQSYLKFQENYLSNYNQLEYLESNYERKKQLIKDSIVSEQQFQKVKSDYFDMRSKVAADTERIKMMNLHPKALLNGDLSSVITIRAAISGTVENINIQGGSYLGQNKEAMKIINTEHIHLQLNALEKDIDQISKNDTLSFQIPEVSKQQFTGEIIQISNVVNSDKKVLIHAHPVKEINFLKVGMFVEAYVPINTKKLPGLPNTAFVESGEQTFILQLVKHKDGVYYLKKIKVKTDKKDEGYQPILNKVNENNQYMTKGSFDLI